MEVVLGVSERLRGGLGPSHLVVAQKKKPIKIAACLVELQEHEAQTLNNPNNRSCYYLPRTRRRYRNLTGSVLASTNSTIISARPEAAS